MSSSPTERPSTTGSWAELRSMEHWAAAMHELLAHAVEVVEGPAVRGELMGARDDAEALRALLNTATSRDEPSAVANATIASIAALWDANQPRFERLAADADPEFHRQWQARTATTRSGRHGPPAAEDLGLPFSA